MSGEEEEVIQGEILSGVGVNSNQTTGNSSVQQTAANSITKKEGFAAGGGAVDESKQTLAGQLANADSTLGSAQIPNSQGLPSLATPLLPPPSNTNNNNNDDALKAVEESVGISGLAILGIVGAIVLVLIVSGAVAHHFKLDKVVWQKIQELRRGGGGGV